MATVNTELLQQYLIELNQTKKELEVIKNELGNILHNVDKTLAKLGTDWSEYHKKYQDDLVKQLKDRGITLTDNEKTYCTMKDRPLLAFQKYEKN